MTHALVLMAELRRRSAAVIRDPRRWVLWPFLPVRRAGPHGVELGVLYDAVGVRGLYGYSSAVFLTNVFQLPATEGAFLALPREVYDSIDELLDAGWRVD